MRKNIIVILFYNYLWLTTLFSCTTILCRQFDLQEKHAALSVEQPFAYFDLNESQENIQFLQSLVVDNTIQSDKPMVFNYYGDLAQLHIKIADFLLSCGNSDTDACKAAEIIHRIASNCLESLNLQEAWIAIRAFPQNSLYDLARWHIDTERLFTIQSGFLYKIVYTLKGASTLFCNAPQNARKEFFKIKSQKFPSSADQSRQKIRTEIALLFQKYTTESPQPGQGTIFIMGSETIGAIHSEPKMDRDRILQELYKIWRRSIENRF